MNIDDLKSNETDVDTNKKTLEVKKNSVYSLFEKFKQTISSKFKRKTHTETEVDFIDKIEGITNSEEGIEDKKEDIDYSKPDRYKKIVTFLKRKITRKKKEISEEQRRTNQVNFYKDMFSLLIFIIVLSSTGTIGFLSTSSNEFCTFCHEMKPEGYTLHSSSHAEARCVDCHSEPGLSSMFKQKFETYKMFRNKLINKAEIPVTLKKGIVDASCERCHKMKNRPVTNSGDIIFSHTKHQSKGIQCSYCHYSVAHGAIMENHLTKKKDLENWNQEVADSIMSTNGSTKLTMDDCMLCHQSLGGPLKCASCHQTGMVPQSHKQGNFINEVHGMEAIANIKDCDSCHKYMKTGKTTLDDESENVFDKIKENNSKKEVIKPIVVSSYTVENDFCRKCHLNRPESHNGNFFSKHGNFAKKNDTKCMGCHPENMINNSKFELKAIPCNKCHPSIHDKNEAMYKSHPIPLVKGKASIKAECFNCHPKDACSNCHVNYK